MKEKVAKISILANVVLSLGKILAGVFSGATSVLADGVHSLTDVFSSAVSFWGIKKSSAPKDKEHPYGHYKYEVLAGAIITVILFLTGAGIAYEAIMGFFADHKVEFSLVAVVAMAFSAIINELMSRVKIFYGKKESSFSLISDGTHSRVDVFSSIVVFAGLFLNRYFIYTDSILAILIGFYIIYESFSLGREAMDSLLDVSAGEEVNNKIVDVAKKMGVKI